MSMVSRNASPPMSTDSHPIDALRARNPALFERPDFWKSRLSDIEEFASSQSGTLVSRSLGRSAGGREIPAFTPGPPERMPSTATISSAMASDRPASFYDPAQRSKPTLALIGSIHGGETEGIVLAMNILQVMANGCDFRGKDHPSLRQKLDQVRLVVVPCLNPDGRAAAGVDHLCGAELEDLFLVQQGLLADGTLFRGRKIKELQPIPPGHLRHMGGYYNANGVNLQHDDFFGPSIAPESAAIRSLFQEEIPDGFLTCHAHGAPAAFLAPDSFLSPGTQRKQVEAVGFILAKLHQHDIPFLPPEQIIAPPWSFYFQTWLHHMTGATPLLFEFCHGLKTAPMELEAILETGLVMLEAWIDYTLLFGARPRSNELFGAITPAK